ncbi:MAG: replicative DNA helicase [Atopobiaceae bacterium]|nr:replicative DNA helicase [Atopobiaceae bacterium]
MPVRDDARPPAPPAAGAAMPQDPAAEVAVLSAMLISPDVLQQALVDLSEQDFYIPSNQMIFSAMHAMFDKSLPVDVVSLADYLASQGRLDRVGGRPYLIELGNNTMPLLNWEHHAEILRRDTTLRLIIEATANISALAYSAPEDTKEVVNDAERMLFSVTDRDVRSSYRQLSDVMEDLYTELEEMANSSTSSLGIETGFTTLDNALQGLRPGQMVVVGARPGVGKTSFALSLAANAASKGASVALFSLEMSSTEVAQRLLAAQSNVGLQDIRGARIKADQWKNIIQATGELSQLDIMIDDKPDTTITEIRAKARRMLHNKGNGLVIIDYLQLVSPPPNGRRSDSRATEVSEMSRGIKIMAKDLGVPVIALSQLSRETERRTGKRPQLSDLRESGSIEQDADIVILLDRSMSEEEAARADRPDPGVTQAIVAKNRSGPLVDVDLTFLAGTTKFVEVYRGTDY